MKTYREFLEETKVRISGAPDRMVSVRARIADFVIDGRPIGDSAVDAQRTKQQYQRFVDQQWCAVILTGTGVDRDVVEARTLPERSNVPTPDFELKLRAGRSVYFEVTQLTDEHEREYISTIGRIARLAEQKLRNIQLTSPRLRGEFHVRFYDAPPRPQEIDQAAEELSLMILTHPDLESVGTTFSRTGAEYSTSSRLGMHVVRSSMDGEVRVTTQPMHYVLDGTKRITSRFDEAFGKKAGKFGRYTTAAEGEV
ncbi:MAG TPA: hypothetical protein VMF61_06250 [Candidatus Acidoferrales bacterium]|nr:hypothetical protein [Candidatus Acidoferrales bacterium]